MDPDETTPEDDAPNDEKLLVEEGDDTVAGGGEGGEGNDTIDGGASGDDTAAGGEGGDEDELIVSLGDAAPEDSVEDEDSGVISGLTPEQKKGFIELRRQKQRFKQQARAHEAELQRLKGQGAQTATPELGVKPTLEACGYDEPKFEAALEAWSDRKRQVEADKKAREEAAKKNQDAWIARIEEVDTTAAKLKLRAHKEALQAVADQFSIVQQGIIINGPKDPKLSAYLQNALGHNPKFASELAKIDDPVRFAFALAELVYGDKMKVTKKVPPTPERVVRGDVAGTTAVDAQLAKLQAQADRTGDRTPVAAYLRKKARAAA